MRCLFSISGPGVCFAGAVGSNVPAAVTAMIAPRTLKGTGVPAGP
jgi:hypothetical protein